MDNKIRVWIADCHILVGAGLKALLEREANIEVLGLSGGNHQCVGAYSHYNPDVAIMDMTLKGTCCLDAMRHIIVHDSNARILVISSQTDGITISRMLKMGAKGYISIESAPDTLIEAVRMVARGGTYIEPTLDQQLAWSKAGDGENLFDILTGREFEVFLMLVDGQTVNEIALSLNLSRSTVANHHTHILHKLGASNHVELTKLAIRHGVVEA